MTTTDQSPLPAPRRPHRFVPGLLAALAPLSCGVPGDNGTGDDAVSSAPSAPQSLTHPSEARFGEIRQLTFQGENAEAYWAFDGTALIFQSTPTPGEGCDQIYTLDPATGATELVSTAWGARPAPTSTRTATGSSTRRPITSTRPARPRPTALAATRGRSTRASTSSRPTPTAPTFASSPPNRATTPRRPSRRRGTGSSSPQCATATSTSTRCSPTAPMSGSSPTTSATTAAPSTAPTARRSSGAPTTRRPTRSATTTWRSWRTG